MNDFEPPTAVPPLFREMAVAWAFPDYFGHNRDALVEYLGSRSGRDRRCALSWSIILMVYRRPGYSALR